MRMFFTALGAELSAPRAALLFTSSSSPACLSSPPGRSVSFTQFHQPLRFCDLSLHLHDELLQLLLALLTGVGVDIAGVLFAVGPLGRVAPLKQVVVDLSDAAGAGLALAAHVGLEIGHARLFRCGRGSFLPRRRSGLWRRCFADATVDVGGGRALHIVGDVGVDVQRGGRRHMAQHGGEGLHVHAALQGQRCKCMPLRYNYDKPEKPRISRVFGYQARFFILFQPEKSSREVIVP